MVDCVVTVLRIVVRQVWKDAGWRRSEVKLGDVWVNFDALEPWSQTLNIIADIGDATSDDGS